MTILDMPNYLWISIVIMIVLTIFCTLMLNKWFFTAILSFVILGVLAFILPNFYHITYEPLLGFAAFVSVLSLILSLILWYFTRHWRKKRQEKKYQKELSRIERKYRS
ncbi:hypothetical protein [Staphylococcus agnetis]|uniref:hypothetical protein n=1 Tax=Staphylococcus agnetis TaxID=985762 RepID=UPI000D1B7254|nr:hypothetical protein [Staphylococcus agnetis]NJH86998.1 hypothetical protein [Staphylococcus agnetis]NJI16670.1 hypothetical protein [Staphylococcus agnetis]PTH40217.1 hypothetical protein BU588_05855 [Staphylococcus agnetis]